MTITTLDGVLAGMQASADFAKAATGTMVAGRGHSLFYQAGYPGAAIAPTCGIGGEILSSYAGSLLFSNPVAGNSYIARLQAQCTVPGTLMLCDRLWHNSGIDVTSLAEQAFTGAETIPPRDMYGQQLGHGVFAAVEVTSAVGAGTPTLTLNYLNQAGEAKTGVNIFPTAASAIQGSFYMIGLSAGDMGVRKAVSLTLSATWTSGAISVVLYRPIARLELGANIPGAIDALTGGLPRVYDNSVLFLVLIPGTTTTSYVSGQMIVTQG